MGSNRWVLLWFLSTVPFFSKVSIYSLPTTSLLVLVLICARCQCLAEVPDKHPVGKTNTTSLLLTQANAQRTGTPSRRPPSLQLAAEVIWGFLSSWLLLLKQSPGRQAAALGSVGGPCTAERWDQYIRRSFNTAVWIAAWKSQCKPEDAINETKTIKHWWK